MSAFELPKSPGGLAFGSAPRFKSTHATRSPGPAAYETATQLNFSHSTLSRASSQPSFPFSEKFSLPGSRQQALEESTASSGSTLHMPTALGIQASSSRPTAPAYSVGSRPLRRKPLTPGPNAYRIPQARVYEDRRERNFGTDDRFGETSFAKLPAPTSYSPSQPDFVASFPFQGRRTAKPLSIGPGPAPKTGSASAARDSTLSIPPSYTIGMRTRRRVPMEPSPASYDQRSLFWSGKSQLGRASTACGASRSSTGLSLHKDVQASQPSINAH